MTGKGKFTESDVCCVIRSSIQKDKKQLARLTH